jgi:multicomponent Na+:H+ antiporter subunit D
LTVIPLEWLPVFSIILPLAAGFILVAVGSFVPVRLQAWSAFATTAVTFSLTVSLLFAVMDGQVVTHQMAGWRPPFGIVLAVDSLNGFVAAVVAGITMLAALYSIEYMKHEGGQTYYYALLMLILSGMMGITLTGDLFNLFVFLELSSVATYALVAFNLDHEGLEAGIKYCIMGATATSMVLLGIALLYGALGTLNMADIAQRLAGERFLPGTLEGNALVAPLAVALLIWGFGVKAAVVPMHTWLPDAHPAAPSPISAILSGVYIKVGLYAMVRVLFTAYHVQPGEALLIFLSTLGVVTMVFSGFMALAQTDIKRLLAFSSVMNIGYILFGVGIGSLLGLTGGLYHLLNHAVLKSLLFLAAGVIVHQTGVRDMSKLGGLGRKMPLTMGAFAVGGFGIAGVPPLNGFVSKWIIFKAAIETGQPLFIFYVLLGAVMSVIAVAYIVNAFRSVFLGQLRREHENLREAGPLMLVPMLALMVAAVVFGVFPQLGLNFVEPAVQAALHPGNYVEQVLGG